MLILDMAARFGLSLRVIMRRRPVGVTLAWLVLLIGTPLLGAFIYLLVGERWLGRRRLALVAAIQQPFQQWLNHLRERDTVDWTQEGPECEQLARVAEHALYMPALAGNHCQLLPDWQTVFEHLIADIDQAQQVVHLEFYIWNPGGAVDDVAEALIRAATRGVYCRVLVDAIGSRDFLRSAWRERFRAAGIEVSAALPGGIFRMLFARLDLRLHRKIVVIDGDVGYTGSLNLVDPRYFKQDSGVGQWVDAMVRIQGPAVEALGVTFLADWAIESDENRDHLLLSSALRPLDPVGDAAIQVCPSGPTGDEQAIYEVVLTAIYAARRELILTSPYFVPDETLLMALIAAAHRGVAVTLIVPKRVDSLLVRLASQTCRGDLADAGVQIMEFDGGLLHTKSITVDGEFCLFGSLNLDPRSLYLNFEITLCVYHRGFTKAVRDLQQAYLRDCEPTDIIAWHNRPAWQRFLANIGRLLSPLL